MSLMRLLSVSRSFCSNVPEMGRYKISRRGALPDFRRPPGGEPGGWRRATQGELAISEVMKRREVAKQGTLELGRVERGVVEPKQGSQSQGCGPARVTETERVEYWAGWWMGWVVWLRRMPRGLVGWLKPRVRRRAKRQPVQTAFLLETVKVVRNDLTEADAEMVVMKTKRGNGLTAGNGGVAVDEEPARPLSRIAAKLFTTGRSR